MNWIRENKFLAGFIGVMVIGAGVLGYLLFTAWGAYSDATDAYNTAAQQLHGLQTLTPYPDQTNLAKYKAELNDLKDATHDLATNLSGMVLPVKEMAPSAFQDQLRATVSDITAKAEKTGVKIPEKFALDFDQYQQQQPPAVAAGPLGRQLEALDMAVNILLDNHVDAVTSLARTKLPEESGAHPAPGAGHPAQQHGAEAPALVEKNAFEVKFTADQTAFQSVLNAFAASSKQFFITRTLVVENSDPKPVSKTADNTAAAAGAPGQAVAPTGAPAAPGAPGAVPGAASTSGTDAGFLQFIVGTEKVEVTMRVEMVAFNPPEKSTRK